MNAIINKVPLGIFLLILFSSAASVSVAAPRITFINGTDPSTIRIEFQLIQSCESVNGTFKGIAAYVDGSALCAISTPNTQSLECPIATYAFGEASLRLICNDSKLNSVLSEEVYFSLKEQFCPISVLLSIGETVSPKCFVSVFDSIVKNSSASGFTRFSVEARSLVANGLRNKTITSVQGSSESFDVIANTVQNFDNDISTTLPFDNRLGATMPGLVLSAFKIVKDAYFQFSRFDSEEFTPFFNSPHVNSSTLVLLSDFYGVSLVNSLGREVLVNNTARNIQINLAFSPGVAVTNPSCVWWKDTEWSTTGCSISVNGSIATCSCNHLTIFALGDYPNGIPKATDQIISEQPQTGRKGLTGGQIAGIVIGVIVFVAIVIIIIVVVIKKKRQSGGEDFGTKHRSHEKIIESRFTIESHEKEEENNEDEQEEENRL